MKLDFETKFTGWTFIAAAVLLWGGWVLSPHHIGEYIQASDFTEIGENVWYWIWITGKKPFRVVLYPGIGMVVIGTFTIALAAAYFYNYGSWGVGKTAGKTAEEVQLYMDNLLFTNQYVTCFMRFGRIFSGVGLILLGAGLVKWNIVKSWLGWFTILLGLVAMCIILFIPDYYEIFKPMFHVKAVWLLLMGIGILKWGVNLSKAEE
jgi:magnesium-transporting ATPase (P-type)